MKLRLRNGVVAVQLALLAACAHTERANTLASLRKVQPDTTDVRVDNGLAKAVDGYRQFLQETPASELTPEAMRRLADLQLEKEYGVRGTTEIVMRVVDRAPSATAAATSAPAVGSKPVQLAAPEAVKKISAVAKSSDKAAAAGAGAPADIERQIEQRATEGQAIATATTSGVASAESGPLESIQLYDKLLAEFPNYAHRDQVLYQKARAYDELGRPDDAMAVMEQLVNGNPGFQAGRRSAVPPRRELLRPAQVPRRRERLPERRGQGGGVGVLRARAVQAWLVVLQAGCIRRGAAPLFRTDRPQGVQGLRARCEAHGGRGSPRRGHLQRHRAVASPTSAGPEVIGEYFAESGHRPYEDHAYRYLGEFYLSKQRYQDAATVYKDFVALYPFHATSPDFGLRVIGIYEAGGFPQLVVEAKRAFAANYGLKAEYWKHHAIGERPEVVAAVKSNLMDLANYYHARYQDPSLAKEKQDKFRRSLALVWRLPRFLPQRPGGTGERTTSSRTCCVKTATSAVRRRSTSARPTSIRPTRKPRLRAMRRSSRIARTSRSAARRPIRAGAGQARDGRQFAAIRRHFPAARAGTYRAGGRRAGSVRPEGLRGRA